MSAETAGDGRERRPALTKTQEEQLGVERNVFELLNFFRGVAPGAQDYMLQIWHEKHVEYLMKGLFHLAPRYHVLDANRPWVCYWIIHSITLLGEVLDDDLEDAIVDFLNHCQDADGGYGGGPGQLPHLATTYAAVNSLVTLGTERALSSINRNTMYQYIVRMKDSSGSFRMHTGGETDVRACYLATSVASLLNILDSEIAEGVGDFIARCQTYEGGIAGEPHSEAHGGYTYCGLAAIILLDETEKLDLPRLIDWAVFRQGVECGFQGRTNKLVDGCYSFWQAGSLFLIQKLVDVVNCQLKSSYYGGKELFSGHFGDRSSSAGEEASCSGKYADIGFEFLETSNQIGPLFHAIALQQYILLCCQDLEGGFKDKIGKPRDHYHSCYCLSGLSVSQRSAANDSDGLPPRNDVLGSFDMNLLEPVHPLYNVVVDKYRTAYEFFSKGLYMLPSADIGCPQ